MLRTRLAATLPVVSLWIAVILGSPAKADPIEAYGNLGNDGSGGLGTTSTTTGTAQTTTQRLAAGFRSGTSVPTSGLLAVTLGIATPVNQPGNRTVGLYSSVGGNPGLLLVTSSVVNVSDKNKYTFMFDSFPLTNDTAYWLIPSEPLLWYVSEFDDTPDGLNSSGFTYVGTKRYGTGGSGLNWYNAGTTSYALSLTAVPEPSSLALCVAGLGTFGLFVSRRRPRRSAAVARA